MPIYCWQITLTNGDSCTGDWSIVTGKYNSATQPMTNTTWQLPSGNPSTTNRQYKVIAWYDANTNGTFETNEYHRLLYVAVLKVNITGFTKTNVWPLHVNCLTNHHQTTCLATIQPTGISTLNYSIQGDAYGAAIDMTNGIVTPGYGQSGVITIRTTATVLPTCYAETNLTIHAIPVAWVSSVVVPPYTTNVYGAGWIHTFSSSGGSLTNVYIAEAISNQPPNPFGYDYNVPAPPPVEGNQCELTDGGTMVSPDYYQTACYWIDATKFTNFPQTATDNQWYFWNCPNCNDWLQFTGPHPISVILCTNALGDFEVKTEAYGQTQTDPYVRP
jgi:hypothetical protein